MKLNGAYSAEESYENLRTQFVNASQLDVDRRWIVDRFEEIDRSGKNLTTPADALYISEAVLSCSASGDLAECGCFRGGMTAKLSILAKVLGVRLHVYDSFAGLPPSSMKKDHHFRRDTQHWVEPWEPGRYAASLEEVQSFVRKHGELEQCQFIPGWFSDTLSDAPELRAILSDVDLAESSRDTLRFLWPRLGSGGVFFSHDVAYLESVCALCDPQVWNEFGERPVLYGAGGGLSDLSPHLGFFVKEKGFDPTYVNSLLIEK